MFRPTRRNLLRHAQKGAGLDLFQIKAHLPGNASRLFGRDPCFAIARTGAAPSNWACPAAFRNNP
jgi:hypothetical protein